MKTHLLKLVRRLNKLPIILTLAFVILSGKSEALTVTRGTINTVCVGVYRPQLTDIIIAEGLTGDFNAAPGIKTLIISSGLAEFKPNTGSISIAANGDITSYSFSINTTSISISYVCPTTLKIDTIRISGLSLRNLSGASGFSQVVWTAASTGVIN